jgi:predicted nucleotide-binding protein
VPQKPRRGASLPEAEAVLLVSRSEMDQAIARRLELGRDLLERRVSLNFYGMPVSSEVASLRNDFNTWDEYNEQLLTNQFSTGKVADDYRRVMYRSVSDRNTQQELKYVLEDIGRQIRKLESIRLQLELYEPKGQGGTGVSTASLTSQKVFIVHGHDGETKLQVADFIQQITGERPIILNEQADSGLTVIEKFEAHASETGFVAVLLTADDVGGVKGATDLQPRARQNVVFEFGYFIAKLGRGRVVALYESGVELPSDVGGMLYTSLAGNWHTKLAKELAAGGIEVDLRKAL